MSRLPHLERQGEFFSIERPHPNDAPSILSVHQQAFVWGYENNEEPEFGASREALEAFVHGEFAKRRLAYWGNAAIRGEGIYVARLQGTENIVGIGETTDRTANGHTEVTALYVLPDFQRRGIGGTLLRTLVANSRHAEIRLIVTRWAYAAAFYGKRGFVPTQEYVAPPEPPKAYGITLEQTEMVLQRQTPDREFKDEGLHKTLKLS